MGFISRAATEFVARMGKIASAAGVAMEARQQ
jgi:hypothetical protein